VRTDSVRTWICPKPRPDGDELGLGLGGREPWGKMCDVAHNAQNLDRMPFVKQSVAHCLFGDLAQQRVHPDSTHNSWPIPPLNPRNPILRPALFLVESVALGPRRQGRKHC
jgi:hypothetical protein